MIRESDFGNGISFVPQKIQKMRHHFFELLVNLTIQPFDPEKTYP